MKAGWYGYSAELDKLLEDVEPIPATYKCFVERESTFRIQKTHTKSLYEVYKCKCSSSPFDDGTSESGNALVDKMTNGKR